jgi:hypothetical protein
VHGIKRAGFDTFAAARTLICMNDYSPVSYCLNRMKRTRSFTRSIAALSAAFPCKLPAVFTVSNATAVHCHRQLMPFFAGNHTGHTANTPFTYMLHFQISTSSYSAFSNF